MIFLGFFIFRVRLTENESDCNGFAVLVTRVTNLDATLNRKKVDASVKKYDKNIFVKRNSDCDSQKRLLMHIEA